MKELLLQNTRLDGRYDVLRLLGRGSYAEIFVARDNSAADSSAHKTVVIKALNVLLQEEPDEDLERTLIENFQNEAVALDRVRHKNIISRLGHGTARDLNNTIFHYIVLEYLSGGDLAELSKRARLSFEKTLFYIEQVAAGLGFAHSKGVIHRDIKPNNLLLTADQQTVKIADFGVAKFGDLSSPITRVGTNIYAAPEHSPLNFAIEAAHNGAAEFELTPAADVYSLAKTVYALLTGESPRRFANQPITNFPASIAAESWANPVLAVLEKATQTKLGERTKTVAEFWQQLCAVSNCDDSTKVAPRADLVAAASLIGTKSAAPARPAFDSQPNVQIAPPALAELPERPRVVVEFSQPQKQSAAATAAAQISAPVKNAETAPPIKRNAAIQTALNFDKSGNSAPVKSPNKSILRTRAESTLRGASVSLAVVLIIVGMFAALLAGTYTYLQSEGFLPAWVSVVGHQAVVDASSLNSPVANLRAESNANSRDIGDVANGSTVKILNVDGNWYEIEVRQRSVPKKMPNEPDRGWVNKKLVEVQ